ncbi:conserved Plasmodium protein, unknown function [Plasmodium berghei]|uniref:Uncharacterized protein n=1 Tax=Plasmodium berghei TaxID=5821 RepID=A0A1D3S9F9_PLABE|nr:conserved Plasmodium protein, unknown function [Plasmodium berghei]
MWKSTFSEPPEEYTQDKERHKSTFFSLFNKKKKSNKSGYSASENSINFSKSHEKSKDKKKKNGHSNEEVSDSEMIKNEVEHTKIPNSNYLKNYDSKNKKRESFFQKINLLRKLRNYKIKKSATTFYMDHEESSSLGLDDEHMGKNEYVKKKKYSIKSEFINLKNKAQSLKNSIYFSSSKNSIESNYYNRSNKEYMGKKGYNIFNLNKENSKQFNNPYSSEKANSLITNDNIKNKKDKYREQDFSNVSNISCLSEKKNNNNISHNSSDNNNSEKHKNKPFFEQKFDVDIWKENNNLMNDKNHVTHFGEHSFNIKRENEIILENYYKDKEKNSYGDNNNLQSNHKDSRIRHNSQNGELNRVVPKNGYNTMYNKEKNDNNNNIRGIDMISEYMKNEKTEQIIGKDRENKICNTIQENEIEKKGKNIKAETNYTNNLSKVNNIYTSEFTQNRTDNIRNNNDIQKEMILKLMYNNKGIYFNKDKYIDNSNNRENNIYKNYAVNNENIKYIPRNKSNINFKNKDILNITQNNKNNVFSKEYKLDSINHNDNQNNIINKYIISPLYNLFAQTKNEAEKKLSTSYNKISSLPYHQIFQKYTSELQKTYKTMYDIYEFPKMCSMEYSKKSFINMRSGANNNNHNDENKNENKNANDYMDWNDRFYRNTYTHTKPSAYKNIVMINESNAISLNEHFKKNEIKIHKTYNNEEYKSNLFSRKTIEPVFKICSTNGSNRLNTNHLRNNSEIINNPSVCRYNNTNHILQRKLFNINASHRSMGMINNKREDLKYEQKQNINFLRKGNNFYENSLRNNNNYNSINANIVTNIYLSNNSKKNNSVSNSCHLFNNKNEISNNSSKYYACKNGPYNNTLIKSNTLHPYYFCNKKMNTNSYKNMNIHNNENYYNNDIWTIRCKYNSKQKYAPLNMNTMNLSKSIGYYPILQKSKTNINSSINNTNIKNNLSASLNEYNEHVLYPNDNIAIHNKYTNCFEPINNEDIFRKNYLQKKSQSLNHRLLDCYEFKYSRFKNNKNCDNNFFINRKNDGLKNVLGMSNLSKTNNPIEKNIILPTENMDIRKINYNNLQYEPIHHNTRNFNLCNSYDHHFTSSDNNYLSDGYIKSTRNICNNNMFNGNINCSNHFNGKLFVSEKNRLTNSYTNNMLINDCNNLQNKSHRYIRAKSLNALRDSILHSKSLKVYEDCCIKNKNENITNHDYNMKDIYKRCSYIGNENTHEIFCTEKSEICENDLNGYNIKPVLIKSHADETNEKTNNILLNDINSQIAHKKNDNNEKIYLLEKENKIEQILTNLSNNENDSDNCTSVTIQHYTVNNADNNKVGDHVLSSYNICEQEESLWMPNQYKIEKAILKESSENYIHKEEFQNGLVKCRNNFIDNGINQCEDMLSGVIEKKENTNCKINDDEKKNFNDKVDQNDKEMIDICVNSSSENCYIKNNSNNHNNKYSIEKESKNLKDVAHDDFEHTTMTTFTIINPNIITSSTFENNASTCEMIKNYNPNKECRNVEINNDAKKEKEKYDNKKKITKSTNNSSKIGKNNKLCKLKKASITKKNWKNREIGELSENEIYKLPSYLVANMCNTVFSEIDENTYEYNFIKNKNVINKQKMFINFNSNYLGDTINFENDNIINSSDSTPILKKNRENEKNTRHGNKEASIRKKDTNISTTRSINISKGSFSNKNIKKELSGLGKSKINSKKLVKRSTKKGTVLNKNSMVINSKDDKNRGVGGEEKYGEEKKLKKNKIMQSTDEKVNNKEEATKKKKINIKKKKCTPLINKSEDSYLIGKSIHSITYMHENEININFDIELDDCNTNNGIETNGGSVSDTIYEKDIRNEEKINMSINSEDENFINKLELCSVPEVDSFYKMFKTMNNMLRNINNSNFLNNIDLNNLINIEKYFINNNIYINKYLITTDIENDQLKEDKNENDSIIYDNNFSIIYLDNDMIYLKKKKLKNILDILLQNKYSFYEIKITILLLKLFISIENSNIHTSIYPLTLINSLIHKLNLKVYDKNESIEDIKNHMFNKIENFNIYKNNLEQSSFNYLFICDGENYLCINDNSLCGETYQTKVNVNNELGYYHYINLNRLTYYGQGKS